MKPAAFDYVVADSIDMAVVSLAEAGGDELSASSWRKTAASWSIR